MDINEQAPTFHTHKVFSQTRERAQKYKRRGHHVCQVNQDNMRMLIAILFCCALDTVNSLSEPASSSVWKGSFGMKPSDCRDRLPISLCQKYSRYCEESTSLTKLCPRSCKTCRAISPLPCKEMPFGCCWDGISYATGPGQKGCPACKDKHPKCSKYATGKNCEKISTVKKLCPVSCGLCSGCHDDPEQVEFCPTFKKSGFCNTMAGNMRKLCQKTCNLCSAACK